MMLDSDKLAQAVNESSYNEIGSKETKYTGTCQFYAFVLFNIHVFNAITRHLTSSLQSHKTEKAPILKVAPLPQRG